MHALFHSCSSEVKHLEEFQFGGHNDTWVQPGYFEVLNQFFSTRLRAPGSVAQAVAEIPVMSRRAPIYEV